MKKRSSIVSPIVLAAVVLFSIASHAGRGGAPFDPEERLSAITSLIESKYLQLDHDLETAALQLKKTGLSGERARAILRDLCQKYEPSIVDCATIDSRGIIVTVEPEQYREVEGKDISDQEQVERLRRTRLPTVSSLFKAVEGFYAVDFEWPVIDEHGKLVGSVSALFRPYLFTEKFVHPEYSPMLFNVWLMQTDGRIIYSRDKGSVGNNFLPNFAGTGRTDFPSVVERISKLESGKARYHRQPIGAADPDRKSVMWKTLTLRGTPLRVVIFFQ